MSSKNRNLKAIDGNMAAAHTAHATNEVIAIYPITPSSGMGEISDEKSAKGEKNIWGVIPQVTEMQSEGGAAGAVHGSLTAGALTTTFTASQGLLLMIPNMFKIAGELTPTVFHVSARTVATHALSIFGDHSDVMACRGTGWAMLASNNPQEAMDMALVAQAASLKSRIPFLHFFDGFRTSHELNMAEALTHDQMKAMLPDNLIAEHKARGLNPERPEMRGTAQNPDVFFQCREAGNKYYNACPEIVEKTMAEFEKVAGRKYGLFEYVGAADAKHVVVIMCSGADTAEQTASYLNKKGEKVGVMKVRLYRPFSEKHFISALPKTAQTITALDKTKEPGAVGEPLFQDVCAAINGVEGKKKFNEVKLLGGRYGLSSKEFTPAMVKAVFDNAKSANPKNGFTVGINDDVTKLSLDYDQSFDIEPEGTYRAMFYGLGSDGTVGANKNTIKIISSQTDNYAQGYFVYDSKKAGSLTVSHIRFGKEPIKAPYLISKADFVGIHQFSFLEKYEMLSKVKDGGVVLLTSSPYSPEEVWDKLPLEFQKQVIDKKLKLYAIDAAKIAEETGLGARINMVMQTAFFAISGVLEKNAAIQAIKDAIVKTYSSKGAEVVKMNHNAVDAAVNAIKEVKHGKADSKTYVHCAAPKNAPEFVKKVTCEIMSFRGDDIPVSAFPVDGTFPTATTQYEKRNIALECPSWDSATCIQCGICSLVCPHAAIRMKAYNGAELKGAPASFKSADGKGELKDFKVTVQVAVEDCTGCGACIHNCPAHQKDAKGEKTGKKAINFASHTELRKTEIDNFAFFLGLKDVGSSKVKRDTVKGSQLVTPLFEFSGACAGCGETPYVKLLTQLFGDRLAVANATGCSSIYGGNLPTTPYAKREDGRGPVWSNSLFEDNAEFGLGMKLAYDKMEDHSAILLKELKETILKPSAKLVDEILSSKQDTSEEIEKQRARVAELKKVLSAMKDPMAQRMLSLTDALIKKSVWILGGDGWAYDIGYGGLDHVLASGKKVRMLVLDTEVYSNTGGQMSKSTPLGAVAAFAAGGKPLPKKDLGMISMTYGNIYVAQIAMGANYNQAVKAMAEAEAFDGPSIVIAYSHCIAHGINMRTGMDEQKKAVSSGRWVLYRYNPALKAQGKNPLTIDSPAPTTTVEDFMMGENRFKRLKNINPEMAKKLMTLAEGEYKWRLSVYKQLAGMSCDVADKEKVAA